jgi:hypothetical protein
LNGSKLTFDLAAIDFIRFPRWVRLAKTAILQRPAPLASLVWPDSQRTVDRKQTASLTCLSRLPDSRLTRFKKIQFRFNRRLNHRSSPVHD